MFFIISRLIFLHSIRFNNKFDFVSNEFSILVMKVFIYLLEKMIYLFFCHVFLRYISQIFKNRIKLYKFNQMQAIDTTLPQLLLSTL